MKIFDLHLDLEVYFRIPEFLNMRFDDFQRIDFLRHGDIPQFQKSGLKFAVANIFPFYYKNNTWESISYKQFLILLARFKDWIFSYDVFKPVISRNDLINLLKDKNKIGIILGVEGLNFIDSPKRIEHLYKLGIRCFGLNWNIDSVYSTSLKTNKKYGLSKEGIYLIKNLEDLNVVIDLAHSSSFTVKDIFRIYKKQAIFSHNGVKKIVNFEQNLNMETINKIKQKGGLIGLTMLPYSLSKKEKINIDNFKKQYLFLKEIVASSIAIGTDFFGFRFRQEINEGRNYLEFSNYLKKIKADKYFSFYNAFNFFKKNL
jgi:membrane dipeptidase